MDSGRPRETLRERVRGESRALHSSAAPPRARALFFPFPSHSASLKAACQRTPLNARTLQRPASLQSGSTV